MQPLHIKFDFSEALNSKKLLLSSIISMLNIQKKLEKFRQERKKEFRVKSKLKTSLNYLDKEITKITNELPKTKEPILEPSGMKTEKRTKRKIEKELREIKYELDYLNKI